MQIKTIDELKNTDYAVIVSCTGSKAWHKDKRLPKKLPAKAAYTGTMFKISKSIIEKYSLEPWFILSAKYGLISPEKLIEDYEATFNKPGNHIDPLEVWKQFRLLKFHRKEVLLVLAGRKYVDVIAYCIGKQDKPHLVTPIRGLSIGKANGKLKSILETGQF